MIVYIYIHLFLKSTIIFIMMLLYILIICYYIPDANKRDKIPPAEVPQIKSTLSKNFGLCSHIRFIIVVVKAPRIPPPIIYIIHTFK